VGFSRSVLCISSRASSIFVPKRTSRVSARGVFQKCLPEVSFGGVLQGALQRYRYSPRCPPGCPGKVSCNVSSWGGHPPRFCFFYLKLHSIKFEATIMTFSIFFLTVMVYEHFVQGGLILPMVPGLCVILPTK
jgi:hypothetical protein